MPLPLDLFAEVTAADGTRYRWDANQAPGSRLMNFSFRTKIGEGFSDANGQLARRIDADYPDLNLVDSLTAVGADGSIAYEGRNSAMPRDLSDRHSIGVTLAGWMAHAKDRKFSEIYVDRDVGQWGEASIARRVILAGAAISMGDFAFSTDAGAIMLPLPNQALGPNTIAHRMYRLPAGCKAGRVAYRGATTSYPPGWTAEIRADDNGDLSSPDNYTPTLTDTLQTLALATPRGYVWLQASSNGTAATPAPGANLRYTKMAVYGNHGLTTRTGDALEPDGLYLSDIVKDIAARYCPLLDTSGVQQNAYVVQHCAFRDRTFPYAAFLELNKYALWHLGVWDNRQLVFKPYDLTDYDWEIRTDDPGTTFSPQGPSTEDLFNGIEVTHTDPLTGTVNTLIPDTSPTLADTSTTNPWNQHGVTHWDEITLTTPTLAAQALLLGQAALADRNRPRTPGTITIRGYVRDRAGNPQPVWKVRAGDTISVTNFPNDIPRLIVETDYDDEQKMARLSIDKPFALVEAYLDRQQNALQAAGLA